MERLLHLKLDSRDGTRVTQTISNVRLMQPARLRASWLVSLSILGLTGVAVLLSASSEADKRRARIEREERHLVGTIRIRMDSYVRALEQTAAFLKMDAERGVERLGTYVEEAHVFERLPGLQGVGYVALVKRTQEVPAAKAFPRSPSEHRFIVQKLVPDDWRNQKAVGQDLYSEPARRRAIDRAWQLGTPSMTGAVSSLTEAGPNRQAGFLAFAPVFAAPGQLRGLAYMPFRANDFFTVLLDAEGTQALDYWIFDSAETTPVSLLYGNAPLVETSEIAGLSSNSLPVAGRSWTVVSRPRAAFFAELGGPLPELMLAFGVLISFASFLFLRLRERQAELIQGLYIETNAKLDEKRAALRALEISDARHAVLGQIAGGVTVVVDPVARRIAWGEGLERVFGHPESGPEINRLDWLLDLVHPDDQSTIRAKLESPPASATDVFSAACRFRKQSGAYAPVLVRGATLGSGKDGSRFVVALQDLSHQESVTSALQSARDRLALALVSTGLGTFDYSTEDDDLSLSPVAARMLDLAQGEAHGLRKVLKHVHVDDRDALLRAFTAPEGPEDGEDHVRVEARLVCEGSEAWVEVHGRAYRGENGRIQRVAGVMIDTTERKHQALELERARREAEAASYAKSLFLANVSHEIRTPLGVILGYSKLLDEPKLAREDRRQFLDTIERSGRHLTNLIDDILDLSKIESGRLEFERVPFSLTQILEEVRAMFELSAKEKGLGFSVRREPEAPEYVIGDPVRLRQVLTNLVNNAVKFTDAGEVSVDAKVAPELGRDGNLVLELRVRDTGAGISPAVAAKLFEPFTQADPHTTRRFGGSGLGLALSRRLAKAMGGDVVLAASAEGDGSTFLATIDSGLTPAALSRLVATGVKEPLPPRREAGTGAKPLQGLSVLVAEDAIENQELIRRILTRRGAAVAVVDNGAKAVDAALAGAYDVVLMDLQMPVLDGLEATATLRRGGYGKPIVALTAHALREERDRCLAAGFDEHLSKPIDFERLCRVVRVLGAPRQERP